MGIGYSNGGIGICPSITPTHNPRVMHFRIEKERMSKLKVYRLTDLQLKEEEFEQLKAAAEREGKSMAEFVRMLIIDRLSEQKEEQERAINAT
jgi:hypothetical protein